MSKTTGPKLLNDAGVPADGSFDFGAALESDPLMPKYSAPEKSNTGHKLHRKLIQAQQLSNNHIERTGNLKYFVAAAEYCDTRDVREQELSGAEEVDEIDIVVYVLSKNMDNQTGAGIRLPPGRIDPVMLREMLDAAMDYVARDIKRQPGPAQSAEEQFADTLLTAEPLTVDEAYPLTPCEEAGCSGHSDHPEGFDDIVSGDLDQYPLEGLDEDGDCVNPEDYPDCPCCAYDEAEGASEDEGPH